MCIRQMKNQTLHWLKWFIVTYNVNCLCMNVHACIHTITITASCFLLPVSKCVCTVYICNAWFWEIQTPLQDLSKLFNLQTLLFYQELCTLKITGKYDCTKNNYKQRAPYHSCSYSNTSKTHLQWMDGVSESCNHSFCIHWLWNNIILRIHSIECNITAYLTNRCVYHSFVTKLFPQSPAYLSRNKIMWLFTTLI